MAVNPRILVIDDEIDICMLLTEYLHKHGYHVSSAYSGKSALNLLEKESFDLVLTDFRLGDIDGLEIIIRIKDKNPSLPVVMITGYSDIKMAVRIIKLGAYDYVTKPIYPDEILLTIKNALADASKKSKTASQRPKHTFIAGESKEMRTIMAQLEVVAETNYRIMLQGESGTGKESLAHAIHNRSKRSQMPFIAIDCGALSRELGGSELFGHEKGAFTGAASSKAGPFESADGGTLFLDEIDKLTNDNQLLLLRVLQENKVRRIGGSIDIPVDVRIIVASNENLALAVTNGTFRQDLYHRLNEFSITIPPLRERKRDVTVLAEHFLQEANLELKKNIQGFTGEVTDTLLAYSWPGNVLELKNVIRRAALITEYSNVEMRSLPPEIVREAHLLQSTKVNSENDKTPLLTLKDSAHEAEAAAIMRVLREVKFNRTKAAKVLNIDRKTLYNKMKLLNILQ